MRLEIHSSSSSSSFKSMILFDLRTTSIERYFSFYFYEIETVFLLPIILKVGSLFLIIFWETITCYLDWICLLSFWMSYFISFGGYFYSFNPSLDSFIYLVDSFFGFLGPLLILSNFITYSFTYFLMSSICLDFFKIL